MFTPCKALGALIVLAAPLAWAVPVSSVSTSSAFTQAIQISQLAISQPSSNVSNSTTSASLSFVVEDGNATALCSADWSSNSTYPQGGYTACANSTFGWNFEDGSFTSLSSFTLQIEYTYEDDSVGQYPYNRVTEFARANVTQDQLTCTTRGGARACHQRSDSTIRGEIWATIAK